MALQNDIKELQVRVTAASDELDGLFREINESYEREYKTPRLNIVTTMKDKTVTTVNDRSDGRKQVTVMKYYTVKPMEYFVKRDRYDEHNGVTMYKTTQIIKPRKFYSVTEAECFVKYINRIAGRTLEDDEMMLLLRTITNGRQYELVCLIDGTREFKKQTMWEDDK